MFVNRERLLRIECPVLVIHGMKDWVVPISNGQYVFDHVRRPAPPCWVPGAGHNDVVEKGANPFVCLT